ncbi:MAG: lipopolysaccharide biosynthesis protein [Bacteroidota bacterium]
MISKSFIKRGFIYTVAGALPLMSAVILLPFYLAWLPAEVYGGLSLYLAFSLFIQVLVSYSFDTSIYIHYHEFKSDPAKLGGFIVSVFLFILGAGLLCSLLFAILGNLIFGLGFTDSRMAFFPYGMMSVGTGIVQAIFKVYTYLLQSREKPDTFLWANLIYFGLIAGLTIGGLHFFPGTLDGPVGGRLIAGGVLSIWVLWRVRREFGFRPDFTLLRSTFGFNNYSFIYQLLQWVINYTDRFVLVLFLPLSAVGIYDLAVKCLLVIELLLNGAHSSFYPRVVSEVMQQENKTTSQVINRYYHGLTAMVMLLAATGILVLPFAASFLPADSDYRTIIPWFPLVALVYLLKPMRTYFGMPYGILKLTRPLPIYYLVVSGVKLILMFMLIKPLGISGVVIAGIMAGVVEILLLKQGLQNRFTFRFNFFKIVLAPVLLLIMVTVMEPVLGGTQPILAHSLYLLFATGLLVFIYRNELRPLLPFNA